MRSKASVLALTAILSGFSNSVDRYAARNANFVLVASDRIAVLAARSAARDTGNRPRGSTGISRDRAPWLVESQSPSVPSGLTEAIWNGDLTSVRRLLAAGEDPLKNDEHGAPPYLAPWEWAVVAGNNEALQLLLNKVPTIPKDNGRGDRRLATAAGMNNIVATRALLARGLPVNITTIDGSGATPLLLAASGGRTGVMKLLIDAGADVSWQDKHGDSPLMAAIRIGSFDAVKLLLTRGARLDQQDNLGRTALMWAARTGRVDVVRVLLDAGANLAITDDAGQTALIVAVSRGHAAAVETLRAKGARLDRTEAPSPVLTPRAAVEKSIPLLQRGITTWVERARCGACHHRPMIERVTALARQHGFAIDEAMAAVRRPERGRGVAANGEPRQENEIANSPAFDLAWVNHHFAEAGTPRDATREATALALASMQLDDGRWNHGPPRVPIEGSPFVVTAAAARVLQVYGPPTRAPEMAVHVDRARRWLAANAPKDTHDEAFRILGLHWTGTDQPLVRRAADALKREQNPDGGWTQLRGMNSDAYMTGLVLVALHEAAGMPASDPAYRRGVEFLLRNQEPDGSWLVHTRAVPQNPYFESGFPHGKFQFISYAGSCWATMALIYAAVP